MAFDEQGFRKAAVAAGYSADEIESHVAKEKQLAEPKLPESNSYEDFSNKDIAQQPSAAKRLEQKAEQVNPAIPYLAAAGAGAVGTAAAIGAGKKIYNSLTDKMAADVEAKQIANKRIEPDLNVSNKPVINEPMLDMAPAPVPTQATETVNPVQAMKDKLLASGAGAETKEDFIKRQFGPRYNPNPTPYEPVPPVGPETPPVTPVAPKVENVPVSVVKPTDTNPGIAAMQQALNPEEKITPPVAATNAAPPPEGTNAPVIPTEEQKATAEKAVKEKMPLFSDADKKAFTSEQRSVLQHMQYGKSPEEAKALLRHFENTLPEGVKLSYGTYAEDVFNEAGKKVKTAGTSKGGFPEPKQNLLNFWNEALGTNHAINEKGNFDYKPTAEDVSKAHSYWSDKLKTASSPAEIAKAQKGFASLGALASAAGVSLAALGAMSAYKEGKETGDFSNLGLLGGSLLAGASAPAQVAYQAATYSKPLGETQEQLKEFGKRLEYANKVGYGRGTQGSTGGGQGFRGIAPPTR
jgi:hypothetical protein